MTTPWPLASTRISQASGRFSVAIACLRAVDIEPAMRAGTDAGIFLAAPVDQIMLALRARRARDWKSRRPAGHAAAQTSCVTS